MSERLLPEQRIRKKLVFDAIFKQGRRVTGTCLNLWTYEGPEIKNGGHRPQIAIMVSRKVSLRANQRNLWKRRIREAFRKEQAAWKQDMAFLFQAKPLKTVPVYSEIKEEVFKLIKKAGGLK